MKDDIDETIGQTPIGGFTVEARIEGVSEAWAEALAMWLATMGLTVKVWIVGEGDDLSEMRETDLHIQEA